MSLWGWGAEHLTENKAGNSDSWSVLVKFQPLSCCTELEPYNHKPNNYFFILTCINIYRINSSTIHLLKQILTMELRVLLSKNLFLSERSNLIRKKKENNTDELQMQRNTCGMFVKCALFHYVVYIIDAGKEKHTESLNWVNPL